MLGECEAEDELEEGGEPLDAEDSIFSLRSYSKGEERCPECELLLYTVYFVTCTICQMKIPLGNIREGKLKYRWLNNHRCFCGNKKELLTSHESKYYVWDMKCFTEEAIWREGSELGHQCSVSEHKPIFIAACNMADMGDRIEFYGEDCLDNFLTLVLQNKKYKKCTFIAHNAGGYDCQFVMRWIERHGQKPKIIPSPTSLYRPLQLTYDGVRFIDSWNFITIPLAKFGKCFGLAQSKTDFPHAFSRRENFAYEGAMPAFDTEEDFFSLKHIKGNSLQETHQLREKQKLALSLEASKFYSEAAPDKPLWKYRDQLITPLVIDIILTRLANM
jgi:hypothetical protein